MASNRVIGKNNDLPWDIPADLKYFKDKTKGHIIIMGRKTFESLPSALPKRYTIVVTRQKDYQPKGVFVCGSVEEAIKHCEGLTEEWPEEVFICGGGEIYKQTMDKIDRLYLTEIQNPYDGDAKFPEFELDQFELTWQEKHSDPEPFVFKVYERK